MKREVIEEALSNISEEYIAEALDLHDPEVVSGSGNMKKKIVTIILAAAITAALGATAYAALNGMTARDGEPGETLVKVEPSNVCEDVCWTDEDTGEEVVGSFVEEEQTLYYDHITKVFTFDAMDSCHRIEFCASYLPEGYDVWCGGVGQWIDVTQGISSEDGKWYNINVYYAPQFGAEGSLFCMDDFTSEETIEDGDFIIYKLSGTHYNSDIPANYYLMYNTVDGYLIVIDSNESLQICEDIAAGLEIRSTGSMINYNPNDSHDIYLGSGQG